MAGHWQDWTGAVLTVAGGLSAMRLSRTKLQARDKGLAHRVRWAGVFCLVLGALRLLILGFRAVTSN